MKTYTQWLNEERKFDDSTLKPIFDTLNNSTFRTQYTSNKVMDALDISSALEKMIDKNIVKVKDDSHFNFVVDVLSDSKFKKLFKPVIVGNETPLQDISGAVKKMTEFIKANFKL